MVNYTTAPIIKPSTKSISYVLTYEGTKKTSISDVKSDFVVLHKSVNDPTSGEIHKIPLSTVLSSATSTHTPGFVNLGYFESAYYAILKLVNKDFLKSILNATDDPATSVVRAYWTNEYKGDTYSNLTCIITNSYNSIYEHLFIGDKEFINYAYWESSNSLYTTNPWIECTTSSKLIWDSKSNKYDHATIIPENPCTGDTIFPTGTSKPTFAPIPAATASANGLMSSSHYKALYSTAIPFVTSYTAAVDSLKKGNISITNNRLLSSAQYTKVVTSLVPIDDRVTISLTPNNVMDWQKIVTLSPVLTYNNIANGAYLMLTASDYQFLQNLKNNLNLAQS